jgi:branched-chain amino acid transport system substrate-binding protein
MLSGSVCPARTYELAGPEVGKVELKGLTGPIAFDEKGDIKNGALTLFTFRGGKRSQIAVVR